MPVGNVLVGNAGGDIEHDDTALALDVVTIAKSTELFLTSSIPHVETDSAKVCSEGQRMNLNTEGGWETRVGLVWDTLLDENIGAPMYFFSNSPVK